MCNLHISCSAITLHLSSFSFFTIQQQEQDPTNLYISNLPLSMDEQELENMLKPFGHVISTRILRDSSGGSRGVGFARSDPCVIYCQRIIMVLKQYEKTFVGFFFAGATFNFNKSAKYDMLI